MFVTIDFAVKCLLPLLPFSPTGGGRGIFCVNKKIHTKIYYI